MLKFLKKPYPFDSDLLHNAKLIFLISIITSVFMLIFQPFKLSTFPIKDRLEIGSFTGLITFSILGTSFLVLPSYFKKFFESDRWNVLKEIIWESIILIILFAGYYVYFKFSNIFVFSFIDFLKIIALSFIPIAIIVMVNQNRLLKVNYQNANDLNKKILSKIDSENETVLFESEYKKDNIRLKPSSIIAIKSANNYVEIFWNNQNKLTKHILRMKLIKAEELLKEYKYITKCHRSYLINTQQVKKANASQQGLKLTIELLDFEVPVSETYLKKLKELI